MRRTILFLTLLLIVCPRLTQAATWDLPLAVNDSNTTVSFEVDSTWHLVHGTTKNISGTVTQASSTDPLSIRADIVIPVRFFNTDSQSRDERMLEVMAAERFPSVSFRSTRLSENCTPTSIEIHGRCTGSLRGALTIRDVSKEVDLPVEIAKQDGHYVINGTLHIAWADFNVEDPSILIARLDPTVTIAIRTTVPLKN